jgi:hypothetical protein
VSRWTVLLSPHAGRGARLPRLGPGVLTASGAFLLAAGLVALAACNDGGAKLTPIPRPGLCGAQMADLVGTWALSGPAPDVVSTLSSCSDPALDGTPVGIHSLIICESILPCPLHVAFEVPEVSPQLDSVFIFFGSGRDGFDRMRGSASLDTCEVSLFIEQTGNPARFHCSGVLDAATRTIPLICPDADVTRDSGENILIRCHVQPPISGTITITPDGGITNE